MHRQLIDISRRLSTLFWWAAFFVVVLVLPVLIVMLLLQGDWAPAAVVAFTLVTSWWRGRRDDRSVLACVKRNIANQR